jgi:hypothetical protein
LPQPDNKTIATIATTLNKLFFMCLTFEGYTNKCIIIFYETTF